MSWRTRVFPWLTWQKGETITIHFLALDHHATSPMPTVSYQVYYNHVLAAEGVLTRYRPSAGWRARLRRVASQVQKPLSLTKGPEDHA